MNLAEDDGALFWPVFREYEAEFAKLIDLRVQYITSLAENMPTLSDDEAVKLSRQWLAINRQQNQLKTRYFNKMYHKVDAKIAARFLQVEQQLASLIDADLAAKHPLLDLPKER